MASAPAPGPLEPFTEGLVPDPKPGADVTAATEGALSTWLSDLPMLSSVITGMAGERAGLATTTATLQANSAAVAQATEGVTLQPSIVSLTQLLASPDPAALYAPTLPTHPGQLTGSAPTDGLAQYLAGQFDSILSLLLTFWQQWFALIG